MEQELFMSHTVLNGETGGSFSTRRKTIELHCNALHILQIESDITINILRILVKLILFGKLQRIATAITSIMSIDITEIYRSSGFCLSNSMPMQISRGMLHILSYAWRIIDRHIFVPSVTACPGCGRTTSTTFQELAKEIDDYLRQQMPVWRHQYPGVEGLKVAVMGCIVNGPGESKHADIGISLPGSGEVPAAPVFIDGQKAMTLRGDNIAQEFHAIVENYIQKRFAYSA